MANIILFSHGQLATGLADSCKLIIGEKYFIGSKYSRN